MRFTLNTLNVDWENDNFYDHADHDDDDNDNEIITIITIMILIKMLMIIMIIMIMLTITMMMTTPHRCSQLENQGCGTDTSSPIQVRSVIVIITNNDSS